MPPLPFRVRARLLGALLCLLAASPGGAQVVPDSPPPRDYPRWTGELAVLGANALAGGIGAGWRQHRRGGSFRDGFTRGVLGGTVVYAGKRISVERWGGAGLAGRQVASVGSSVVSNAAAGRPSLERVMLAVGPVNLYVRPRGTPRLSARLNAQAAVMTVYAVARSGTEWDARASLSAGAAVFRVPGRRLRTGSGKDGDYSGLAFPGVYLLSDLPWETGRYRAEVAAHERVHIAQSDQIFLLAGEPLDAWAAERVPWLGTLRRWVDLDLLGIVLSVTPDPLEHDDRPLEIEANFLSERRP